MIDPQTVQQILDAADIVDVVSDFVSLKRRGANWIGLCPFHNDRNPSFYVSRAKGICKCFSCGEGGSAVNFIMKHEQLSYPEALRWLARKYHIDIAERELTDEERQAKSEREAMLMLNEWACQYFIKQLKDTQQGREVGLTYFNERGFNQTSLDKFRLGYSNSQFDAFYRAATLKGFNRDLLFSTGLCVDDGHGGGKDRFRGRVMFPIINLADKVIGFGGRTLSHDKQVAKYVNSPESIIYNKSNELYGLYQARRDITRQDKCFIVEGYADVISMHQAGFTNVIAASGTALTEGQIHAIRRFTNNVTEMFDGDAAGIHAALRGVDMLLTEGFNIKVLRLPPEDDPDSFARSHNATEIQQFIDENETDFIRFKANILLSDAQNDPIKRTEAITDVVKSIACIPSSILRSVYAKECSAIFGIGEDVLLREINKFVRYNRQKRQQDRDREKAAQQRAAQSQGATPSAEAGAPTAADAPTLDTTSATPASSARVEKAKSKSSDIQIQERAVIRLIIKYGYCLLPATPEHDTTTVTQHIANELELDDMSFSHPVYKQIFDLARQVLPTFEQDFQQFSAEVQTKKQQYITSQMQQDGDVNFEDMDSAALIHALERKQKAVEAQATARERKQIKEYRSNYLEKLLCSHIDDAVRNLACEMAAEPYQLSKIHTQFATIVDEIDRLPQLVDEMIYNWKNALVEELIRQVKEQIGNASSEQQIVLMQQLQEYYELRRQLATLIGDRVVTP